MLFELFFTLLALCLAFCVLWRASGPGKSALIKLRAGHDDAGKLIVDQSGSVSCSTGVGRAQTGCSMVEENERGQGATSNNDTAQRLDARTTSVPPGCSESHDRDGSTSSISSATPSDGHPPLQWPWLESAPIRRMRILLCEWFTGARLDVDEEMMEEGQEASVANLQVNIMMLPRADLSEEFREQGFHSGGDIWRVEHVFTSAGYTKQNVPLASLFDNIPDKVVQRGKTFRVVAISSAGCGKTTIFTKVAPFRWAVGELWSDLFAMLFARELRYEDIRQARCTRDLLGLERYHLSEADRESVLQFVRDQPQRVCLVLDGLDETSFRNCSSFVQDVIRGEDMRGIRLVLTSRPSGDIFKLTDANRQDRKVELVGFRPQDVEKYVRKILNAKEAEELLDKMQNNAQLLGIMCTPVLAYEICKLYHYRKQVPRCVAEVFELMILRLAERRSEFEYPSWEAMPESVRSPILSLGSFAFSMLQAEQVVFTETKLQASTILRDAISLGLLVACQHTPAESIAKQWRFSHLTLQESLAAKFIACSGTMTGGKIVQLVEFFGPDAGHMRTFWMLLAAELNAACLETLVNALMMREKKDTYLTLTATALDTNRLTFPLKYCRPLSETLTRVSLDRLAEFLLSPVVEGSGAVFVQNRMSRVHTPSDEDFLQATLTTWVSEFPPATDQMLVKAVSSVDAGAAQLCHKVMEQSAEVASDRPHSLPVLEDLQIDFSDLLTARRLLTFQCFAEYALHHNHAVEPVPSMTEILGRPSRNLLLVSGDQNPSVVRCVEIVVMHHSHALRRVALDNFTESGATTIPPSLRLCNKLSQLMVLSCYGQYDEVISDIIRASSSTLCDLHFSWNTISCSGMESLAPAIGECSQLEELDMEGREMSLDSIKLLATALSKMTKLQKLSLQEGMAPGVADAAIAYLCEALTANDIQKLFVGGCRLSGPSLPVIAISVRHWPNLEELHMSHNDFSNATADQCRAFTEAVSAHSKLRELTFGFNHVSPYHPLVCEATYPRHLKVTNRESARVEPW